MIYFKKSYFNFLKFTNIIISFILSVFFGCDHFGDVEYGAPHADYKLFGKVKSKTSQQPIHNIKIFLKDTSSLQIIDTTLLTDSNGTYCINFTDELNVWLLEAKDIDSIQNGQFSDKDTICTIPNDELTGGDGSWYLGYGEKEIDFYLEDQNNSNE